MKSFFSGARLVLCAVLAVVVYICVHEGGHALAGLATGRTIAHISIFSLTPHIELQGPSTPAQRAFAAAAGSGLVVAIWFAFMMLRRTRDVTFTSEAMSFFAGIELLAWFVSSAAHAIAAPQNDVTRFIDLSGANAAFVTLSVALIAACGFLRLNLLLRHAVQRA